MQNHHVSPIEHLARACASWLDLLAALMPETVKIEIEVSGFLVIAALVALAIWRG